MAARSEQVRFSSLDAPPLMLVGDLQLPAGTGRWPGVVLCHPQPLVADRDDPLLLKLAHDLAVQGIVSLRFNFRGVSPSTGSTTDGRLEPLDIGGAINWLAARPEIDADRLALVGHAFGAVIALNYACVDTRVKTIVAVSPPTYRLTSGFAATLDRPKFFVTGDDDEVCPRFKLEPWIAQLPGPRGLTVISGAQHLMHGYEAAAAAPIVNYLVRWAQVAQIPQT